MFKPSIIVVVGPTASGKSELAVKLAKKFNGEIISADSRQIYRGLDIGSGKVAGKWKGDVYSYKDVPHYLIDEASPRLQYSVARFKKQTNKVIADIIARGKLPIICGGTGHWIDAVVFNETLPAVKPNAKLRSELNKLSTEELFKRLKKLDPERATNIDQHNPRRLVRALEIVMTTGQPVPKRLTLPSPQVGRVREGMYNTIWLGIKPSPELLRAKIEKRLKQRLKQGLVEEVRQLHANKMSWKKLEDFGLEYKFAALYLQAKISEQEMFDQLLRAIKQYAKRQFTWWKRNPNIHWSDNPSKLITLAKELLK